MTDNPMMKIPIHERFHVFIQGHSTYKHKNAPFVSVHIHFPGKDT